MYMGGIDHNDKMCRLDRARKSYKWYTRIYRKCAMWAVYNSYVLYKEKNWNQDYRVYQLNLIHMLVNNRKIRTAKIKVDTLQQSAHTHTHTHRSQRQKVLDFIGVKYAIRNTMQPKKMTSHGLATKQCSCARSVMCIFVYEKAVNVGQNSTQTWMRKMWRYLIHLFVQLNFFWHYWHTYYIPLTSTFHQEVLDIYLCSTPNNNWLSYTSTMITWHYFRDFDNCFAFFTLTDHSLITNTDMNLVQIPVDSPWCALLNEYGVAYNNINSFTLKIRIFYIDPKMLHIANNNRTQLNLNYFMRTRNG